MSKKKQQKQKKTENPNANTVLVAGKISPTYATELAKLRARIKQTESEFVRLAVIDRLQRQLTA